MNRQVIGVLLIGQCSSSNGSTIVQDDSVGGKVTLLGFRAVFFFNEQRPMFHQSRVVKLRRKPSWPWGSAVLRGATRNDDGVVLPKTWIRARSRAPTYSRREDRSPQIRTR